MASLIFPPQVSQFLLKLPVSTSGHLPTEVQDTHRVVLGGHTTEAFSCHGDWSCRLMVCILLMPTICMNYLHDKELKLNWESIFVLKRKVVALEVISLLIFPALDREISSSVIALLLLLYGTAQLDPDHCSVSAAGRCRHLSAALTQIGSWCQLHFLRIFSCLGPSAISSNISSTWSGALFLTNINLESAWPSQKYIPFSP